MTDVPDDQICDQPDAHLHYLPRCMVVIEGKAVVIDGRVVALVPASSTTIAERIVQLLTRHGLLDVPDTPPPAFPPPDLRTWHGQTL